MNNLSKKSIVVLLLMIGALIIGTTAQAKGSLKATTMQIQFKPEYDSPDVLGTYDAYLKNTTSKTYSGTVEFLVPKDINLGSVCEITDAGEHNCQLYDVKVKGDKKLIVWKTGKLQPGEEYHAYLEFYFNPLQINNNSREFNFNYVTTYPVQNFTFRITEPSQASNFTANLEEVGIQRDQYGLKEHIYKLTDLKEGASVDLKVNYDRTTTNASVTAQNSQSTQPTVTQQQPATQAGSGNNPMVIILLVAILGVMGYFIYYTMQNNESATAGNNKSKRSKPVENNRKSKSKSKANLKNDLNPSEEKKRARQLLLDGKISEKTYKDILKDIEDEN
ncbi:hypothetical protein SAMN04515661_10930 [Candidatus Frackibacter sp. WG11]|uniref:hypothetical protein n=1 Tax=Candidatus Frackibacter sp. WG11 TaxID=2017976 RepID=UPI000881A696|nr:hypothetical protein [Candidatus Frackibacter sp. WG11]SDC40218.1 hypothetical protein SAMN04515661_10930 [Candidatus Frackibacter sp. WG11]